MTLADYDHRKFELTEILRAFAKDRPRPQGGEDPVQALMAHLAEDRFNLVVVGRFSRGKSSLMNAILGTDRLPTGVAPLTSVITAVGYGSDELVRITFRDRLLQQDVPLADLRAYVTQDGNPGNQRGVKLAEIQLPAVILRRGFYFVDTPGLGSAIAENTQTTESFLPSADAFLMVTGFDSPLSADEDQVLRVIAASHRPLFVAVNKQDTVDGPDREAALAYVRERLQATFVETPEVFSTSALEALKAKLAGDPVRLQASGVGALETALVNFLVADKSRVFLLGMCDRIDSLLARDPSTTKALRDELRSVRARISPETAAGSAVGGLEPIKPEAAGVCAVCAAIDAATFDFLARYQYDLTVDAGLRRELAQGGGFCAMHTWRYFTITSPHGVCLSYPPLVDQWAQRLADLAQSGPDAEPAGAAIRRFIGSPTACPVCAVCKRAETDALTAAIDRLNGVGAVADESAFCLEHLADVADRVGVPISQALLHRQAGLLERASDDMRRYALKFDAIRRILASRAETEAPRRALRLLAGVANLSLVRKPV